MVHRLIGLTVSLLLLVAVPGAYGAVPFKEVTSGGPLNSLAFGNELSCQVGHTGDAALELFPGTAKPGSCARWSPPAVSSTRRTSPTTTAPRPARWAATRRSRRSARAT